MGVPESQEPIRLGEGDVAIARGPDPYLVADDPATRRRPLILPGEDCRTPDGGHLTELVDLGVRTWGHASTRSSPSPRSPARSGTAARSH